MGTRMDTFYAWCGIAREQNDGDSFRPMRLIGFGPAILSAYRQVQAMTLARTVEPIAVSFVDRVPQ